MEEVEALIVFSILEINTDQDVRWTREKTINEDDKK